jgi:predicted metal-dependent HD superfamily phosphohydrolase
VADDHLELRIAWEQHLGRSPISMAWFDSIMSSYRQVGRHYHGARHICWVVRHVNDLGAHAEDLSAVIAAAFFHDVVHDVTRTDNERASADLADRALTELRWSPERRRRVTAMILATIDHQVDETDGDTQVLLAADLAVLATEPARYGDYVTAVRREYAHVDDLDWCTGRAAVLNGLLGRRHLFAPMLAPDHWEQRARANITAELATLGD